MLDPKQINFGDQTGPATEPVNIARQKLAENTEAPETNIEFKQEIHQEEKSPTKEDKFSFYDNLKWSLINLGPVATAISHCYAGFSDLWFFKDFENSKVRQFVDKLALNFSKVILTASCGFNGWEALKKNRLWEAISRFIEPIFIIAENRTEDLGLARGIGLGISQLVGSQEGLYNEHIKEKLDIDLTNKNETRNPTMGQDHDSNVEAMKKLFKELFTGGIGSQRRFLTGLSFANIKKQISNFLSKFKFASFAELFKLANGSMAERYDKFCQESGISHIQELCKGDESKDKGHTTALSGYTMIIGSILGYLGKANKGLAYKIGGTIRNIGGIFADLSIFGHKDPYFNASAIFLSVNTFMDIVQRFIPASLKNIIMPWSNFSMAAYNLGVGLYLNRSDMKTNQQDKVKTYDTDKQQLSFQQKHESQIEKLRQAQEQTVTDREQQQSLAMAI